VVLIKVARDARGEKERDCRGRLGIQPRVKSLRSSYTGLYLPPEGGEISGSGFIGRLVFKAHRLWYHSTLGLRVIKKKRGTRRTVVATDAVPRAWDAAPMATPRASGSPIPIQSRNCQRIFVVRIKG